MSKQSLVSLLASRNFFQIPLDSHLVLHDKNWSFKTDQYFIRNTKNHPELHERLTQIMTSTFYREANVPMALKLADTQSATTRDFLNKEISTALNSGTSLFCTKPNGIDVISINLNRIWGRDNEYQVVGANVKEWHNAAAEIIATSPELRDKNFAWRNYQFQHIYDVGQKLLKEAPEKKYAIYISAGYIHPEFRRSRSLKSFLFNQGVFQDIFYPSAHFKTLSDCIFYFITTYSKMDEYFQKAYPCYKPFDYISYADQELVLDGMRCFPRFEHLGGITFYSNYLKEFV